MWSWGSNEQGGLGHGTHADVAEPGQPTPAVSTTISDAVEVKAGTFGRQFIVRAATARSSAGATATGDSYWLGGNFSFARTRDGSLWFWGEPSAAPGLLGVRGNQRIPGKVPLTKFVP